MELAVKKYFTVLVQNLWLMAKLVSVISGINGFIGKHLADYLFKKGHKVTGIPRGLLLDPKGLEDFIEEANPDYIFHLATAGNIYGEHNDDEVFIANIFGAYNLLASIRNREIKGFINISTSSVNLYPTMYSATKLSAEHLCEAVSLKYNKPIATIRPYTIFGIGEQEKHLIPTIINSIKTQKEMDFVAGPVHDYVYVSDLVEAIWLVAQDADKYKGVAIDVGSGDQYTNQEVLTILEGLSGTKANIKVVDEMREYDTLKWSADTKIIEEIGWSPKISLAEGLKLEYDWYKEQGAKA